MYQEFRGVGKEINWALSIVDEPADEPISLAEAKTHLRVDLDFVDDDDYIEGLITAARVITEERTFRALVTQTWDYVLDQFPCGNTIYMRKPKLQSVGSIKYKDSAGIEHTLSSTEYIVDTDSVPGRIVLGYNKTWPTESLQPASAVRIRFVAGYGTADKVPKPLKQAIQFLVGHWYENREPVSINSKPESIPMTFDLLIGPYRVLRLQ